MQGIGTGTTEGATANSPVNVKKDDPHYSYMVKVVDPTKKYKVYRLCKTCLFTTCSEIRLALKVNMYLTMITLILATSNLVGKGSGGKPAGFLMLMT